MDITLYTMKVLSPGVDIAPVNLLRLNTKIDTD